VNLLPVNAAPIVVPMSTTTFAVRPQAILLDEAPEGALLLDGTVRGAEFLGATERIYVTTSAGELAIDRPHQRDRATPASGSTTRLAIPYDALVPLSD
jgi:ABC-type Fe3+/spermidine/putrescine transport system ATPase subunit